MLNSIISAILSVYLFFVGVFGIYPSDPTLIEGINEDPVPYLFDKTIDGFRYLHEERELPFRLKAPEETEEGKTYPMVVFLHGSGERGNDNQCHVMLSLLKGIEKNGTPCYILMPQLHDTGNWEDDDMNAALTSLIDGYILPNYPIDTKRIYVTGDSRGGAGTFDQVIRHPGKYAAAMPTCGYRQSFLNSDEEIVLLKNTPLWMAQNSGDTLVNPEYSRTVYSTLKDMGVEHVKYTEYKALGHNCWDKFYSEEEVWEWLFSQSL